MISQSNSPKAINLSRQKYKEQTPNGLLIPTNSHDLLPTRSQVIRPKLHLHILINQTNITSNSPETLPNVSSCFRQTFQQFVRISRRLFSSNPQILTDSSKPRIPESNRPNSSQNLKLLPKIDQPNLTESCCTKFTTQECI
jgi:hypothetical protein